MEEFTIASVILLGLKGIFGVPVGFVLGFFAKLVLLFGVSAVISKILHLDRAFDNYRDQADKKKTAEREIYLKL
jgi:hypothetical protein